MLELGVDRRIHPSVEASRLSPIFAPGQQLIAVLRTDGTVGLSEFSNHGERIQNLLERLSEPESQREARQRLAIMTRYIRLHVNSDGRIILPTEMLHRLGVPVQGGAYLTLLIENKGATLSPTDEEEYQQAEDELRGLDLPE